MKLWDVLTSVVGNTRLKDEGKEEEDETNHPRRSATCHVAEIEIARRNLNRRDAISQCVSYV